MSVEWGFEEGLYRDYLGEVETECLKNGAIRPFYLERLDRLSSLPFVNDVEPYSRVEDVNGYLEGDVTVSVPVSDRESLLDLMVPKTFAAVDVEADRVSQVLDEGNFEYFERGDDLVVAEENNSVYRPVFGISK